MAHFDEEPKRMTKTTMLPAEGRAEGGRRRLHLRDITHEEPLEEHTIGAELRAARLRRGEEIRSIAHILHIRRDYLEALEESRYESLPGKAYALGFVRSYAEYLGLDSQYVVERYKAELDGDDAETDAEPVSRFVPKSSGACRGSHRCCRALRRLADEQVGRPDDRRSRRRDRRRGRSGGAGRRSE